MYIYVLSTHTWEDIFPSALILWGWGLLTIAKLSIWYRMWCFFEGWHWLVCYRYDMADASWWIQNYFSSLRTIQFGSSMRVHHAYKEKETDQGLFEMPVFFVFHFRWFPSFPMNWVPSTGDVSLAGAHSPVEDVASMEVDTFFTVQTESLRIQSPSEDSHYPNESVIGPPNHHVTVGLDP